jgi:uncharacterized protein YegP (UPF0339 family)
MPSKFVVDHLPEGVELRFETRVDRLSLVKMKFANAAEAFELIRRSQEEFKAKDFSTRTSHAKKKKQYRFEVIDANRTVVLESRWYPICQSAERGMATMLRTMRNAEVKEIFTH